MDAGKTGAYLAALRKARGMTQQEAADQLGVSNKTVSKWENGAGLPDITVLPALAELYGVTADDILAGETLRGRPAEAQGPARRRLLLLRLRTRFDLCFIGSLALGVLAAFRVAYVSLAAWPLSVGLLWIGYVLAVHPARYGDISLDAKIWENLYRKLLVSPQAMRGPLMEMIRREIELHKRYGNGEIIFKCNQLVDAGIIRALYRASMAGVRVRLQVRGICCLRPGLPGISENITVTSIVCRLLHDSRIYWFHANGEDIMYIGSADLMPRNLDHRIEVLTPILDPELRRKIREDILEVHLADNVQTWQLQADSTYSRLKPSSKEAAVNAQERMIAQHISRDDI